MRQRSFLALSLVGLPCLGAVDALEKWLTENADASVTAGRGRAARVATSVAIAFAASWKPFVSAKAKAIAMARMNAVTLAP